VEEARKGLIELLDVDELQANAILELQLRRLAALERQKILDEAAAIEEQIKEFKAILASDTLQKELIATELTGIVEKFGDDRRTRILLGFDGDVNEEDL